MICYYDIETKGWTISCVFNGNKKHENMEQLLDGEYLLARQSVIPDIDDRNDHPLYKVCNIN